VSSYFGPTSGEEDALNPQPADEFCTDCQEPHPPHTAILKWSARKFGQGLAEFMEEADKGNLGRAMVMAVQLSGDLSQWARMAGVIAMKEDAWGERLDEERFPGAPEFPTMF
jgi:hypothetical protein